MTTQVRTPIVVWALGAALLVPTLVHAQHSLAAARELYAAAAYDDALSVLEALPANGPHEDREVIGLYRALCLFAVGRVGDANHAIEAIIQQNPLYRPAAEDIPPRVRNALGAARRRLLPAIAQQKYSEGKAAYDRQEYEAAAETFKQVLEELSDPDMIVAVAQPPLADLRTLAIGFHALSAKAAAPPPPPAATETPAPPRPERTIHTGAEPNVIPPEVVQQRIPPFVGRVLMRRVGVVEVVVNESGKVESALMSVSIDPQYDQRVLAAAAGWLYRPAMVGGVPVKFLRRVQVILMPAATR